MILTILSGSIFEEKRILYQVSVESVKKLWEDWGIQILVAFSLLLQALLIVMGNRRKYNPGAYLRMCIWSAYLLADWVATVALSVLFKKQTNSCSCDADETKYHMDDELLAFWAPFLLLHLGGPDTISAYAIADNELWVRHLLGLFVQTGVALYVTYTAWSGTLLSILTIPILIAGFIKYVERSLALMSANREQFLVSLLENPDPGPSYAKFMEEFRLKEEEGFFVSADEVVELSQQSDSVYSNEAGNNSSEDKTSKLLTDADKFFQNFKRLFVDLILSFQDRDKSRPHFQNSTSKDAFTIVEMELGFGYDAFYTKAPIIYTKGGFFCRFIASSFTILVFAVFLKSEKQSHRQINLIITYILLVGAILLECYAVILLLLSDRTNLWLIKHKCQFSQVITSFLPCNKKRWSNSLAQYNLLSFSLKDKHVPLLDNKRFQTLKKHWYQEYRCKISSEMKDFIFKHFQTKSVNSKEKVASLCSARGGLVFEQYKRSSSFNWSTEQVEFDQSILIWHIATDLCYHSDGGEEFAAKNPRCQWSKNLADYMLYLLVMCPSMLPIGIGMMRFRDTCEEAKEFSKENGLSSKEKADLQKRLLEVSTELLPTKVKGDRSKSVLFDGCMLAHQLQETVDKEKKWEFVCNVWIEILGYAATQCRGYYHAQQLAKGGELLTHVWLLMAHLGITEQFQINQGHARAKLVVI